MHQVDDEIQTVTTDMPSDLEHDGIPAQKVRLSDIKRLPELQVRRKMDSWGIELYGRTLHCLPPVDVFDVDGEGLVLAYGDRIYETVKACRRKYIHAHVRQGTICEAYLFAVEANVKSGRLTRVDRNGVIAQLYRLHHKSQGWQDGWSPLKVSQLVGTSENIVNRIVKAVAVAEHVGAFHFPWKVPAPYVMVVPPRGWEEMSVHEPSAGGRGLTISHLYEIGRAAKGLQPYIAFAAQNRGWSRDETRHIVRESVK